MSVLKLLKEDVTKNNLLNQGSFHSRIQALENFHFLLANRI